MRCVPAQVCELVADGARVAVTNANKLLYLDLLAQRRLASSVHTEIEAFLRGLNEFIPDALLSIFDENELEVGTDTILYVSSSMFLCVASFCPFLQRVILSVFEASFFFIFAHVIFSVFPINHFICFCME